ncbi:hypothetical protein [uncultured Moraxella sp.]|uniref:hypothetical protein n=1 Tax=uncultured Moraxella sp. TaxID=263769 RepID=UPI0025F24C66|nr:hypothetical protein [uncultured Moraxella sp.]
MSTITLRLSDDKHSRLKSLAQGISVNRLMDELASLALAEFDAKTRFEIRAKRGDIKRGLALLDKALQ